MNDHVTNEKAQKLLTANSKLIESIIQSIEIGKMMMEEIDNLLARVDTDDGMLKHDIGTLKTDLDFILERKLIDSLSDATALKEQLPYKTGGIWTNDGRDNYFWFWRD